MELSQLTDILCKKSILILINVFLLLALVVQIVTFYQFIRFPPPHAAHHYKPTSLEIKKPNSTNPFLSTALFGKYRVRPRDIKVSSLDLKLAGISYSNNSQYSQAVIELANGKQKIYLVGDKIPGGAVVEKIHPNEIIIRYNGELQRLTLLDHSLKFSKPLDPLIKD